MPHPLHLFRANRAGTGQIVQNQALQDQTASISPLATDSSYQSAPPSVTSTDSLAPAFDPAMSPAFHTNEVSAWDVVNAPETAISAEQETGFVNELAARLASSDSFVVRLDSLKLTEILV
jgi:hypothetical protein